MLTSLFAQWGGAFTKRSVTFSCLGLISCSSFASFLYDATTKKKVLGLIDRFGEQVTGLFSNTTNSLDIQWQPQPFSIKSLSHFLEPSWKMVTYGVQAIFYSLPTLMEGTFNFFRSFSDWGIIKHLFDAGGFHKKIWNLMDLFITKEKREKFMKLFEQEQIEKTAKAMRLLFGDPSNQISKYLNAESNVFSYLFLKFMDDPKEITRKFTRISEMANKIFNEISSSFGPLRENKPYSLNKEKLQIYLDVKEGGCGEAMFEDTWKGNGNMLYGSFSSGSDTSVLRLTQQTANQAISWSRDLNCSEIGLGAGIYIFT